MRLAPIDPGAALGLCEGIETGLAAMTSCPGLPVWATLSATNLEQVKLPPEAHRIVILADHDASGAGTRAAETAARRLRGEGRQVAIAIPPGEGCDFNDVLLREGPEAVAAIVEAAFTAKEEEEEGHAPDATGRHLPIGFAEPTGPLPTLRADEGDLARAVDRAWSVLLASNRTPWLFRAGGLPSWVVPDDEGRPMVALLTEERLRHVLARLANWRRMDSKGDIVPAHPPIVAGQVAAGDARSRPAGAGRHRHHAGVRPGRRAADRAGLSRRCAAAVPAGARVPAASHTGAADEPRTSQPPAS